MSLTEQGIRLAPAHPSHHREGMVLVKVDSVAYMLNRSVDAIYQMADYNALRFEASLKFVFNVATDDAGEIRDLRFWAGEVMAMSLGRESLLRHQRFTIDEALAAIAPVSRERFHSGEVAALLQFRRPTLMKLRRQGIFEAGSSFVSRTALVKFLKSRWLGGTAR